LLVLCSRVAVVQFILRTLLKYLDDIIGGTTADRVLLRLLFFFSACLLCPF
jgi:hypothetical protein